MKTKQKLATSRDVYNRIKWDPSFDESRFVIGWRRRDNEVEEKPLIDWAPDGDIPWHRVVYIKRNDVVVWDREARVDKVVAVTQRADEGAPDRASSLDLPALDPMSGWGYDAGTQTWRACEEVTRDLPTPGPLLTSLTYNVLFDSFARHHLSPGARRRAIFEHLRGSGADLIALQEVEPTFLEALLEQDWVRRDFFVSDGPELSSVTPNGQVLLSRWPMRCAWYKFSPQKALLLTEVDFGEPRPPMAVAVVHLTSDRAKNAPKKRAEQVERLLSLTRSANELMIMGDFNLRGTTHDADFLGAELVDVWPSLRPRDPGYSFDPRRNELADLTSQSGYSGRLDRVLVRSTRLVPADIELFGGASGMSDHFGVLARFFTSRGALTATPGVRSAAVVIPPARLWEPIQEKRREHDRRRLGRWMPHITLLYPFVPEAHFEEAAARLALESQRSESFEVVLDGIESFEHKESATVWASCQRDLELRALQATLERCLPQCDEQSSKSQRGFTPHVTLGSFPKKARAEQREVMASWREGWEPLGFWVTQVALISRRGDGPFEVRRVVSLAGDELLSRILENEVGPDDSGVADLCVDELAEALAELDLDLELAGSRAVGAALPGADLDLVALGDDHSEVHASQVAEVLARAGMSSVEVVDEVRFPLVRGQLHGVHVDLQLGRVTAGFELRALTRADASELEELDASARRAVGPLLVREALRDRLSSIGALEVFGDIARFVKLWARRRAIDDGAFGYWPGIAWSVAACWACERVHARGQELTGEAVLDELFYSLASWAWPRPMALTGIEPDVAEFLPIAAPLAPFDNLARDMCASSARVMREEFARAAEIAAQIKEGTQGWAFLLQEKPRELAGQAVEFLLEQDSVASVGELRGRLLGLLTELEEFAGVRLTPDPRRIDGAAHFRCAITSPGQTLSARARREVELLLEEFSGGLVHDVFIGII